MRQEFRESMKDTMVGSQVPEPELLEDDSPKPSSISPPQVIKSHHQQLADYVRLFMEKGKEMGMGKDWAAPMVTEALQKIHLASHIGCMADLLHAVAIQQLEVALLGTLVAQVIDLLSWGLATASTSMPTSVSPALPHPRSYTFTPLAPPPLQCHYGKFQPPAQHLQLCPQWHHHLFHLFLFFLL